MPRGQKWRQRPIRPFAALCNRSSQSQRITEGISVSSAHTQLGQSAVKIMFSDSNSAVRAVPDFCPVVNGAALMFQGFPTFLRVMDLGIQGQIIPGPKLASILSM